MFVTSGTAGRFSVVPLLLSLGSGLGLLGVATILADFLVVYVCRAVCSAGADRCAGPQQEAVLHGQEVRSDQGRGFAASCAGAGAVTCPEHDHFMATIQRSGSEKLPLLGTETRV